MLPPLGPREVVEVQLIRAAAGLDVQTERAFLRPFRSPHHTASAAALVGGGNVPRPGEISLAHRGLLFLDELTHFRPAVVDALREPLEEGVITIARAHGTHRFPAEALVVAAFNPNRRSGTAGAASCARTLERIGAPILDRFDIHVELSPPRMESIVMAGASRSGTSTACPREVVAGAHDRAIARQGAANAVVHAGELERVTRMSRSDLLWLARSVDHLGLSFRAFDTVRRIARTIADLEAALSVERDHLEEAISFRRFDREEP